MPSRSFQLPANRTGTTTWLNVSKDHSLICSRKGGTFRITCCRFIVGTWCEAKLPLKLQSSYLGLERLRHIRKIYEVTDMEQI